MANIDLGWEIFPFETDPTNTEPTPFVMARDWCAFKYIETLKHSFGHNRSTVRMAYRLADEDIATHRELQRKCKIWLT
jgi:hypothetical protein